MASQRTALVLASVILIAFALSLVHGETPGSAPPRVRPPVQIVVYPDGSTGFFDPALAQLSINGADLKLLKNAKYEQAGKPLTVIEARQQ